MRLIPPEEPYGFDSHVTSLPLRRIRGTRVPAYLKKSDYFTMQTKEMDEILVQTCHLQPFEWSVSLRAGRGVEPPARATTLARP